jgi:hypothetical protein
VIRTTSFVAGTLKLTYPAAVLTPYKRIGVRRLVPGSHLCRDEGERAYDLEVTKSKVCFGATMMSLSANFPSSDDGTDMDFELLLIPYEGNATRTHPGYRHSITLAVDSMSSERGADLQKFSVSASKQLFSFELARRATIESPILEQVGTPARAP